MPDTSTWSPPATSCNWTTDPFCAEIRDGALYGRGALDMKGGVVAGLAALRALREAEVELDGEAVLLTVPAEEDGGAGMLAAIRAGYTADDGGHHRAHAAGDRDRPGRRDHVSADGQRAARRTRHSGVQGVSALEKLGRCSPR